MNLEDLNTAECLLNWMSQFMETMRNTGIAGMTMEELHKKIAEEMFRAAKDCSDPIKRKEFMAKAKMHYSQAQQSGNLGTFQFS